MVCKVKKVTGIFLSFVLIFTLTAPLYVNADSHRYISAYLYEDDNVDSLYYDERKNPLDTSNTIYERIVNSGYNGYVNALDMNLGEYNIDIIEVDDRPLLPLTTISDIAGVTYCCAIYYGDDLSFNYAFQEPFVNWGENLNSLSRDILLITLTDTTNMSQ